MKYKCTLKGSDIVDCVEAPNRSRAKILFRRILVKMGVPFFFKDIRVRLAKTSPVKASRNFQMPTPVPPTTGFGETPGTWEPGETRRVRQEKRKKRRRPDYWLAWGISIGVLFYVGYLFIYYH